MTERERILKLLEEGKITADEAARLLEALGKSRDPGRAITTALKWFSEILRKSVQHLPEILKEVTENPLESEINETVDLPPDKYIQIEHVGGDLTVVFVENRVNINLSGRGYFRLFNKTIELISETSLVEIPSDTNVSIDMAGGDLTVSGTLKNDLFIRLAGGDCKIRVDSHRNIKVNAEAGDVILNLPRTTPETTEIMVNISDGDMNVPMEFQKQEEAYIWSPKEPKFKVEVSLVLGDLTIIVSENSKP